MFSRNTRAIRRNEEDIIRILGNMQDIADILKIAKGAQRSIFSQLQIQGDRIDITTGKVAHLQGRVENLLTRVLQNESITAKFQDESVRQQAGLTLVLRATLSDGIPDLYSRPLTGIRRELCPST